MSISRTSLPQDVHYVFRYGKMNRFASVMKRVHPIQHGMKSGCIFALVKPDGLIYSLLVEDPFLQYFIKYIKISLKVSLAIGERINVPSHAAPSLSVRMEAEELQCWIAQHRIPLHHILSFCAGLYCVEWNPVESHWIAIVLHYDLEGTGLLAMYQGVYGVSLGDGDAHG